MPCIARPNKSLETCHAGTTKVHRGHARLALRAAPGILCQAAVNLCPSFTTAMLLVFHTDSHIISIPYPPPLVSAPAGTPPSRCPSCGLGHWPSSRCPSPLPSSASRCCCRCSCSSPLLPWQTSGTGGGRCALRGPATSFFFFFCVPAWVKLESLSSTP